MSQLSNTQKFKTVTTNLGRNAVAMAHATGSSIKLTHMAVGDGSGQNIEPTSAMTKLVHEVYRGQINDIVISSDVEGEFTAELLIPQSAGGFFIREVGLFFEDGTMFAIGNTPLTEKTELASGAATDLLVRMIIRVLDAGTIEIFIDPAQVLATRDYADRKVSDHDKDETAHAYLLQSLDTKLDKTALSDAIDSESEENAASSAAVKKVNDKIRTDSQITDLCMPDYSAGIDISWASSSNMFTAPCDGIINWIGKLSTGAFINGYEITGFTTLEHSVHDRTFFMPKGALFYANAYQHNGGYNNKFFPLKGASK